MNITLSTDQRTALDSINTWLTNPTPCLTLGGYAGTGKTTLLKHLTTENPNLKIAFVSLTGKAINVLARKLPKAFTSTIHRFMYRPLIDPNTRKIIGWRWRPMEGTREAERNSDPIERFDLIVNDEASMTNKELFNNLSRYNVPILAVGDHGQLPPVEGQFNLMEQPQLRLEKIQRQAESSPIIKLATQARKTGALRPGEYSDKVIVTTVDDASERINQLFLTPTGFGSTIIVASNRQRIQINRFLSNKEGHPNDVPFVGAKVICLRNSYFDGIFNGQVFIIKSLSGSPTLQSCEATLLDEDGYTQTVTMWLGAFNQEKPVFTCKAPSVPFDFAYAVTCHKSQGSESNQVFVLGSGFGTPENQRRWLYTAITRAQEELYVLL